ncbi:26561_t:CDS:2 [Racocetra persica]|uniref:26561_t:CDS:1 n=1 Tax=Racocetra persica TaxID=160502 RepID=A0ACA9RHV3_9GLOM|nr:26561_t:CDS:2 [Racocetra persica]
MFNIYTPHKSTKQNKLQYATAKCHKGIKIDIKKAYETGVCLLKKLIAETCETASLTADF